MNEPEQIVNLIARQTKILLSNHWPDINDFRDGDEKIKIGFSHYISYQGQERIIESTISFGKRMKDTAVERFDTEQMNLNLAAGAVATGTVAAEAEKPAKRRGRPPGKRNILAKALLTGPSPDPQLE